MSLAVLEINPRSIQARIAWVLDSDALEVAVEEDGGRSLSCEHCWRSCFLMFWESQQISA